MSRPKFGTQPKHIIGERRSLELGIQKAREELVNLKMTDYIQAVTKSELGPWTSDSLESALKLLTTPKPER